jgi:hypothetical protein
VACVPRLPERRQGGGRDLAEEAGQGLGQPARGLALEPLARAQQQDRLGDRGRHPGGHLVGDGDDRALHPGQGPVELGLGRGPEGAGLGGGVVGQGAELALGRGRQPVELGRRPHGLVVEHAVELARARSMLARMAGRLVSKRSRARAPSVRRCSGSGAVSSATAATMSGSCSRILPATWLATARAAEPVARPRSSSG